MPIRGCTMSGKPGYKWGDSGTCFPYTPGDDESRSTARKKAAEQGRAIQVNKKYKFEVKKSREDNNLVFGWAYVAKDAKGQVVVDHSTEFMDMEDLEMSMYVYNLAFREGGEVHKGAKNGMLVESMVFTKEKQKILGIPDGVLPEGAWVGLYFPDDKTFQKVKSGEYSMFSIEGLARRKEVD